MITSVPGPRCFSPKLNASALMDPVVPLVKMTSFVDAALMYFLTFSLAFS
jgi:hypothetical protein